MPSEGQRQIWLSRAALRGSLCSAYQFFTHETPAANIRDIRAEGLVPRDPGCSSDDALITELGVTQREMVCLHPVGAASGLGSTGVGPYVLLAILPEAVPAEVTLDWSFPGCWGLVPILENSTANAADIFLEVVRRRGSVSALARIAANHLYVLCNGSAHGEPERWCRLQDANDEVFAAYAVAGQPPSIPSLTDTTV